jgi:GT2 family glycosyltransferase
MPEVVFSIVIPTRGRPESLQRCLQAIARLGYARERFEVVVVFDGEPAEAPRGLEHHLQIRSLTQANTGPAAARNTGAAVACGKYLAFIDDDCEPAADWLTELERALDATPECAVGGCVISALPGDPYATASQMLVDYLCAYFNTDAGAWFLTSNNLAAPRQVFLEVGGFDRSFPLAAAEDRELCLRWRRSGRPLVYLGSAVVHHYHAMNLRGFLRQHYGYGRGARHLRRVIAKSDAGGIPMEPLHFYWGILSYPWRSSAMPFSRLRLSALLALTQASTVAGFLREGLA